MSKTETDSARDPSGTYTSMLSSNAPRPQKKRITIHFTVTRAEYHDMKVQKIWLYNTVMLQPFTNRKGACIFTGNK